MKRRTEDRRKSGNSINKIDGKPDKANCVKTTLLQEAFRYIENGRPPCSVIMEYVHLRFNGIY